MISFLQKIIINNVKRKLKNRKAKISEKLLQKEISNTKVEFSHILHDIFFVSLGIISATIGLKGFLLPNMFIDGGAMGISLILTEMTNIPLSILIVAVNVPFLIMGFSAISRHFAYRSMLAIVLLAVLVHFIEFPVITDDKLLIAVFGNMLE